MMKARKRTARKGQSLVEYGLILALVSVVAIGALQVMGGKIKDTVTAAGEQSEAVASGAGQSMCESMGGTWSNAGDDGSTCVY